MLKAFEKYWFVLAIVVTSALLASLALQLALARILSMLVTVTGITLPILFIAKECWQAHQQGKCTGKKMVRELILDLFGLLLMMGSSLYAGRLTGGYVSLHASIWLGVPAGFATGFVAAWIVRSVWGRFVKVNI